MDRYEERIADAFARRHVYANASSMVHSLINAPNFWEADEYEPLLDVCSRSRMFLGEEETVEAYEHWIISPWLAEKLEGHGELIANPWGDGVWLWGRTTTGQAISMDSVIREIAREFPHA